VCGTGEGSDAVLATLELDCVCIYDVDILDTNNDSASCRPVTDDLFFPDPYVSVSVSVSLSVCLSVYHSVSLIQFICSISVGGRQLTSIRV